jgi:hypothetical protein
MSLMHRVAARTAYRGLAKDASAAMRDSAPDVGLPLGEACRLEVLWSTGFGNTSLTQT